MSSYAIQPVLLRRLFEDDPVFSCVTPGVVREYNDVNPGRKR